MIKSKHHFEIGTRLENMKTEKSFHKSQINRNHRNNRFLRNELDDSSCNFSLQFNQPQKFVLHIPQVHAPHFWSSKRTNQLIKSKGPISNPEIKSPISTISALLLISQTAYMFLDVKAVDSCSCISWNSVKQSNYSPDILYITLNPNDIFFVSS